jgi:ribosome-associated toxin RatA of RatAB toxin-antitoxin module
MTNVSTSVCVNYTPDEMYELVNDVQSYPDYIPMCREVRLLSSTPEKLKATITMAKGKIKLSFTTENTMETGRFIRMRLVEGPFKRLNGVWHFEPSGDKGCEATFRLDFEFANALLSMAFGGFFKEVTESMVDAFCRQAVRKYGPRTHGV